jgi:hypothetical protein
MKNSMIFHVRSMLYQGLVGMAKFMLPGLILLIISLVGLKSRPGRELALRIATALPLVGFLWGLRVYEHSVRFSLWKDYLAGKANLAEAFACIADKKVWIYMIPAAYFCGVVIGVSYFFLGPYQQKFGVFHLVSFSPVTYLLWIPACAVLLLFGANIFGPKLDKEEELTLDVMKILNRSPGISPVDIESPSAIERFVEGATTEKGLDVKPYLWILSHIRSSMAIAGLGSALKNSGASVRQMAVTYLGRIGGGDALRLLQEHLKEETDPEIGKLIEDSLSKLTERGNV